MAKILIIDSDSGMRQIMEKVLSPRGHEIHFCEDGAQSLENFGDIAPDIVLLDISLPDMESIYVMQSLKKIRQDVPFLILSGISEIDAGEEIVRNGAECHIQKPFKIDNLIQTVEKLIEKKTGGVHPIAPKLEIPVPGKIKKKKTVTRKKLISAVISLVMGLALISLCIIIFSPLKNIEYEISNSNTSGLYIEGKKLWVSDWVEESLYKYSFEKKLKLLETYNLENIQPSGLAFDGSYLWVTSSFEGLIYKLNSGAKFSIAAKYPSPGASPSGICFDGENLWSLDFQLGKVYRHKINDKLTVLNIFDSPAKSPRSIFSHKDHIYIADAMTNRIFKMNKANFLLEGVFIHPDVEKENGKISAIGFDGKYVWVSLDGSNKIFLCGIKNLVPVKM